MEGNYTRKEVVELARPGSTIEITDEYTSYDGSPVRNVKRLTVIGTRPCNWSGDVKIRMSGSYEMPWVSDPGKRTRDYVTNLSTSRMTEAGVIHVWSSGSKSTRRVTGIETVEQSKS